MIFPLFFTLEKYTKIIIIVGAKRCVPPSLDPPNTVIVKYDDNKKTVFVFHKLANIFRETVQSIKKSFNCFRNRFQIHKNRYYLISNRIWANSWKIYFFFVHKYIFKTLRSLFKLLQSNVLLSLQVSLPVSPPGLLL